MRVQGDNAFLGGALGGDAAVWLNQGVIRKDAGSGETLIEACYQAPTGGQIIENSDTVRVDNSCPP